MNERPLIALTGATGFIGRHLLAELPRRGYRVRVLLRRPSEIPPGAGSAVIGDLTAPRNMSAALAGIDAVVHSAGLAHAMSGRPEDDYRAINVEATAMLARAALKAGARRFVFLSSIRAQSGPVAAQVLSEDMEARPTDPYGRSKLQAEEALAASGLDWVALRPALVYGAGVKGNMASLLRLAQSRLPLPLGGLKAKRSLLAVENLVEALDLVLRHPEPLKQPFLVADPDPVTLPQMIAALRQGLGRPPGLLPVPASLLHLAMKTTGREEAYQRLAGSLVVDPGALRRLGWTPPLTTEAGLAALARGSRPGA